jgi:hypothetical protein
MSKGANVVVPSPLKRRLQFADDKNFKIQKYDLDNSYPQRVRNAINSSGVATACTNLFAKHLRGRGFTSEAIENLIVNEKKQTVGAIHKLLCKDRAMFFGYAYHIQYNALLEVVGINHVPFEYVRLMLPDDRGVVTKAKVFDDWAREKNNKIDEKQVKTVDLFTDDVEMIQQQIEAAEGFTNWNGHLVYFSDEGHNVYPKAVCDPVFEDVMSDAGIKIYKNRQIVTGWLCDYILVYKGVFESERERQDFVDKINEHVGFDRSHKILVVESPTNEDVPELKKLESADNDEKFKFTEESVRENIIRAYNQPKALHSISVQGSLGLTKEIQESKEVYDERTNDERNQLAKSFELALKSWFEPIPEQDFFFEVLAITGEKIQDTRTLADRIGVGGLQSMQAVLESTTLSSMQKINFMVEAFSLEYAVAAAIVNGTPLPTTTPTT